MTTLRELDPAAARELARLGEAVAKLTGQADNDTPLPIPAPANRWKMRPPQLDDRVTEEFGGQTGVVVNVDHPGQRAFVTIDGAEGWYDWDDLRPAEPAGALTMPALPFRLAKDGSGRELELDHVDGAYYIQATHRRHGVAVNVDLADVMRGLSRFMPESVTDSSVDTSEPDSVLDQILAELRRIGELLDRRSRAAKGTAAPRVPGRDVR